jgi:hypothetical protein
MALEPQTNPKMSIGTREMRTHKTKARQIASVAQANHFPLCPPSLLEICTKDMIARITAMGARIQAILEIAKSTTEYEPKRE